MTTELKRWVIESPTYNNIVNASSELLAWFSYYRDQMSESLANPIQTITTLDYLISVGKNQGLKAVEKTYREVEQEKE